MQFEWSHGKLNVNFTPCGRKRESMICKHCGAETEEGQNFCPNCGEALVEEEIIPVEQPDVPVEETAVEIPEDVCPEQPEQKPKKKIWKWVLLGVAAVAALAALAIFLLSQLGVQIIRPNNVQVKDAYLVSDEKAVQQADVVVAQIGDKELTNAQLQIYYKMQIQDFLSYYSSYLSSIGLDYTQPLSEQASYFDPELTWEQYFLDAALEMWQNYRTMGLLAEEADFTMSEAWQEEFEKLPESLASQAEEGGYESTQQMVEEILGAGCTVEDYAEYIKLLSVSNEFYATQYEKLAPTDEEIDAYFKENEALFTESGVTKESGLVSSVRHILITPECEEEDAEGECSLSEQEWEAAKQKAEKLLEEWKNGEATEESFGKLANENSDDGGSNTTGGLYEDVTPLSNYVEEFLTWAVDMSRKPGDTGIVKTDYGYHIMYFVSGEPHWEVEAGTMLLSERTTAMIEDAEEKWPMKVSYRKIILTALDLG